MKWRGTATTAVALLAITAGIVYLCARALTLGTGWMLATSVPLYAAELLAFTQFALFTFVAWHAREYGDRTGAATARQRSNNVTESDIVVDCADQDASSLERTLVGVRNVRAAANTIVVDRSHRDELAETAAALGATYAVDPRPSDQWVDVLLDVTSSEYIAWLSAGQVPMTDFIEAGCVRLADPKVAVWQSAIGLLNSDSFAHVQRGRDEDAVVRTVIAPGVNLFGAGPWNGPGSIVRRHALELLGVDGATRSIPTTRRLMLLHRSGWTSSFESEAHVRSLAPDDLDDYLIERRDRARSALGVLGSRHNPLICRGLSPTQRLAHLALASPFLTGMRQAAVVLLIIPTLVTGVLPVSGNILPILGLWVVATTAAALARRLLAGDSMRLGDWTRHGWRTVGADVAAALSLLRPPSDPHAAHGESVTGLRTLGRLRLLTGIVIALDLALLARGATIVFETALPAFDITEKLIVISFGLFALVPMVDVLHLVVARKQRRKNFRLDADLNVRVGDTSTTTIDLSTSGVGVLLPYSPIIDSMVSVQLDIPDNTGRLHEVDLTGVVRAANRDEGGQVRVGIEFTGVPATARRALIAFCMAGTAPSLGPSEVAEPQALTIHRPAGHQVHPVRALTAIASVASLAMLFFGPSTASASSTELEAISVSIIDTDGNGVQGAEIRSFSGSSDRWQFAATTNTQGTASFQVPPGDTGSSDASFEILWNDTRIVLPLRETNTVFTSRIDAGGSDVEAINTGHGWIEFSDGIAVLPGRVALRFADGSVLKTQLDPGNVLDAASGVQIRSTESATPPTTDATSSTPTSTSSTAAPTTTTTSPAPSETKPSEATTAPDSPESTTTDVTSSTEGPTTTTEPTTTTTSAEPAPTTTTPATVVPTSTEVPS